MSKKEKNAKRLRNLLIVIFTIQIVGFFGRHISWFGNNQITNYFTHIQEVMNDFLEPQNRYYYIPDFTDEGLVFIRQEAGPYTWKHTLQAIRETPITKVFRYAIPVALALNLLEPKLRRVLSCLTRTGSGLSSKAQRAAKYAFQHRPACPVIQYRQLCAVRVQTFGIHPTDQACLLDSTPYVLPDETGEVRRSGSAVVVVSKDNTEFPLDQQRLIITRINSAGKEVLHQIITQL